MAVPSISGASPQSGAAVSYSFPWKRQPWLWPHLFSLDAPLIAVLWQVLLIRDLAAHVDRGEPFVLALCVWFVYVADRVFDAMHPLIGSWEPARKAFYRNHLRIASTTGICLFLLILPLAYSLLRRSMFYAGLALGVALFLYFVLVHLAPMKSRARWPREMAIACLFTSGAFLAIWIGNRRNAYPLWAPAILFSLLCWANLSAIETWEWQGGACHTEGAPSSSTQWAARHLIFVAIVIACLSAILGYMAFAPLDFSAAAFTSGVALAALAAYRSHLPLNGVRVAADLALCTPLPLLILASLK